MRTPRPCLTPLLFAAFAASGCSSDPVAPANVTGTYTLTTAAGSRLPAVLTATHQYVWEITGGTLVLDESPGGNAFTLQHSYRVVAIATGQVVDTTNGSISGTFSRDGTVLTLNTEFGGLIGDGTVELHFEVGRIRSAVVRITVTMGHESSLGVHRYVYER